MVVVQRLCAVCLVFILCACVPAGDPVQLSSMGAGVGQGGGLQAERLLSANVVPLAGAQGTLHGQAGRRAPSGVLAVKPLFSGSHAPFAPPLPPPLPDRKRLHLASGAQSPEHRQGRMREDFDSILPALRDLIDKQEEESPSAPPKTKPELSPPPSSVPAGSVTGIRFGAHPMRTRIVMDLDAPAPFSPVLSEEGRGLRVNLAGWAWESGALSGSPAKGLYVTDWRVENGDLVLRFSEPVRVALSARFPPAEGRPHRYVLDVVPR